MGADEPALLDLPLPHRALSLPVLRGVAPSLLNLGVIDRLERRALRVVVAVAVPQILHQRRVAEAAPVLVECQGVAAVLDQRRGAHVVMHGQATLEPWNRQGVETDGADGVVNAEIGDPRTTGGSHQQALRDGQIVDQLPGDPVAPRLFAKIKSPERTMRFVTFDVPGIADEIVDAPDARRRFPEHAVPHAGPILALSPEDAVVLPQLVHGQRRAATQDAAGRDESDERSRGVRTAAEPEDVDFIGVGHFVAVVVVGDEPVIGFADVLLETEPEASARDAVEDTGPDTLDVVLGLDDRAIAVWRRAVHGQGEMLEDVRAVVAVVPGTVETDYKAFPGRHDVLPSVRRQARSSRVEALRRKYPAGPSRLRYYAHRQGVARRLGPRSRQPSSSLSSRNAVSAWRSGTRRRHRQECAG